MMKKLVMGRSGATTLRVISPEKTTRRFIKGLSTPRPPRLRRHWFDAGGAACASTSTNYTKVITDVTCLACRTYHVSIHQLPWTTP
jgi:hypothetical protein